ncbi:MAG TPA: hypothetical protein VFG23_20660 [Polyangia bacterium]|nr:hypothetical protein [Polyangia bacterium]
MVMLVESKHQPLLDAMREDVALDPDVSDALDALRQTERESLSVVLSEARDLAGRLAPRPDGERRSQLDLESWLGAVLRGPHDRLWFEERVRSGMRGWSNLPPVVCVLVIGRVRQRLTEIATMTSVTLEPSRERIADALARLFDLELVLVHFDRDLTDDNAFATTHVGPLGAIPSETSARIFNALGVIETSAYLVGRYSAEASPGNVNIERHLDRISRHVQRTNLEIVRLVGTAHLRSQLMD